MIMVSRKAAQGFHNKYSYGRINDILVLIMITILATDVVFYGANQRGLGTGKSVHNLEKQQSPILFLLSNSESFRKRNTPISGNSTAHDYLQSSFPKTPNLSPMRATAIENLVWNS